MTGRRSFMKRLILGALIGLTLLGPPGGGFSGVGEPQREGRRVAVVVGNNAYPEAPLRACRNDARAVGRALQEVGFAVTLLEDGSRQKIADALSSAASSLRPDDIFFFYFSGHGSQAEGENFLIPVDYDGDSVEALRLKAISANDVQRLTQRARVKILVLDACRTNPYARDRAGGNGLALMEARGTLIAFATGANQVARDGASDGNGVFTAALLETLRSPGLTVDEVFKRARQKVYAQTNGEQWPAVYNDLTSDVVLKPGTEPAGPGPASSPGSDIARREELALWESIKDLKDPRVFQDYLQKYPNGRFKVAAEARLAELGRVSPPARPSGVSGLGPIEAGEIDLSGPFTLLLEKTPDIRGQKFLQFADLESMVEYLKDDPDWKNGEYSMTSVAAGEDGLLLVLSKLTNEAQSYVYEDEFPKDEVKKKWDEGYRITEVGVVPGRWFVVMTKNSGFGS
ncbi:MAG: caspase family protein, partial [Candidatus Aminicenantes bacterium]|nr:caspase family protein [Candidatus Aminicenantes bacterium]